MKADQVTVVIIVKIIIVKRIYTIRNKKADNENYQLFFMEKIKKANSLFQKKGIFTELLFITFFFKQINDNQFTKKNWYFNRKRLLRT